LELLYKDKNEFTMATQNRFCTTLKLQLTWIVNSILNLNYSYVRA
jgi:hypothetical protein